MGGMNSDLPLPPEPKSLAQFTEEIRKAPVIQWYRTPLPREELKALHERSDLRGWIQTGGYLAIMVATATASIYSSFHWPWWITLFLVFLHGTVSAFMINAIHELGHGTVFKTKWLNNGFCHLFAFLNWTVHDIFQASHTRHHRYTLHPPDDLEVVLPIRLMIKHYLKTAWINPVLAWQTLNIVFRIARGRFRDPWTASLFPESDPKKRAEPIRWARILLIGHGTITLVSLVMGWWIVPVVVSLAPFYGAWIFFLCNNTQHIGLQDNVPDFRLCCRTFTLNPVVRFLYWQMNYHTEHHMYAAVPCYNLGRLHQLIRYDLPPCPDGIYAVWKQIAEIQAMQEKDPSYQYSPVCPNAKMS